VARGGVPQEGEKGLLTCTLTKGRASARVAQGPPCGEGLPLYRVGVIAWHILEAYVIQAYQQRELGTAHLRRLLGFETRDEFEDFLAAHNVPRNYTLADLEHDRETARLLGL
jgi:hypothetical protein